MASTRVSQDALRDVPRSLSSRTRIAPVSRRDIFRVPNPSKDSSEALQDDLETDKSYSKRCKGYNTQRKVHCGL